MFASIRLLSLNLSFTHRRILLPTINNSILLQSNSFATKPKEIKKTKTKKELLKEVKQKKEAEKIPEVPDNIDTGGYRLEVSLIVEREPICPPVVDAWEADFYEYRYNRIQETGFDLSGFESGGGGGGSKDKKKDKKKAQTDANKSPTTTKNEDIQKPDTATEYNYPVTSLITEHDQNGNRTTLYRALTQRLFLIVKTKDSDWHFPTRRWQQKETLRDTAIRTLRLLGKRAEMHVVGNAPLGHLEYTMEPQEDGTIGRKV